MMLSAEELLAGGGLTRDIVIPAEFAPASGAALVRLPPLTVPDLRRHRRDLVCGRPPGAWRRACARGTAWLREFAAATSWVLQRDPIDRADWNASPFGARLGELTSAVAERVGAVSNAAPPHRRAW